ncbi:MAG: right-handed parallel beta-helix repeat-containing protein [Verrucomicrobiales bacterium]|nr:right-handed parallel beta-helix repeat-containing protein [Verrucomicrobiales bacterium]
MKIKLFFLALVVQLNLPLPAATYHVRPDGSNDNSGLANTVAGAWKTMDRGQSTSLLEATVEGQTEIKVARALQFPSQGVIIIGAHEITYTARTTHSFTGCKGVKDAKVGSLVKSKTGLKPGDKVVVHEGVYSTLSNWPEIKGLDKFGVVISSKGTKESPIVFEGEKGTILDGRHLAYALRIRGSEHTIFRGFDIRRWGVSIWQSANVKIESCRVHEGKQGINVAYSKNIEITGNLLYSLNGAWTGSPIKVSTGSNYYIHKNTIAESKRPGIKLGHKLSSGIRIENNLITRCLVGIEAESSLEKPIIKNNLLWNLGGVRWLTKIADKKEGLAFYKGLDFTPQHINEDPGIISFDQESIHFLATTKSSPCLTEYGKIGAGKVYDKYPVSSSLKGLNLVMNSGFENGFKNWHGSAWQESKIEAAGWSVRSIDGQSGNQCLEIYHFPSDGQIQPRVRSSFAKVDRGYPVTISFRAKSKRLNDASLTLDVGFLVPSWNLGSTSFKKRFAITSEWQTYSFTARAQDYYPNKISASFLVASSGRVWIDDVMMTQHTDNEALRNAGVSIDLSSESPGTLINTKTISYVINNRQEKPRKLMIASRISTPDGPYFRLANIDLALRGKEAKEISIILPKGARGAVMIECKVFEHKKLVANTIDRLVIGEAVPSGRNKAFVGVNPLPSLRNAGDVAEAREKYKIAAMLGIGTWHYYLNLERMKTAYQEPWVEAYVDAARDAGIEWLWTLDGAKLFTGERALAPAPGDLGEMIDGQRQIDGLDKGRVTESQLSIWNDWVTAVVKKFDGKVNFWEILNEPNCYVDADEYLKILKVTSPIIRRESPNSVIIAGSVVNSHRKPLWNKTITEGSSYFDQFSFHPYRFGLRNPYYGRFPEFLAMAKEDLKKAGSKAQVALTEEYRSFGAAMIDYSSSLEKNEANNTARMYVRALGENCASYHHHHDFFRDSAMSPNLGLASIHTMMSLLSNAVPPGEGHDTADFVAYYFEIPPGLAPFAETKTKSTIVALWTKEVNYASTRSLTFPAALKHVQVKNLYGNRVLVKDEKFSINRNLVYILLPGVELSVAKSALTEMLAP